MDAEMLSKADTYIREQTPDVRALLVVRHGYIVFEGYYQGHDEGDYHDIRSATKSFISALIGIALREQSITGLDQRLVEFFPEYFTSESDPRASEITIRDLLTMTGGFEWDEMGSQENLRRWFASDDKVKFLIDQPLSDEPGRVFNYNSAGSHMLSAIITKTTGESALEFANRHLFSPLGISTDKEAGFSWPIDAQGYNTGGYGLRLTVRDMAKFGYLYLNNGFWDGKQIIPADYAGESTRQQSEGGPPERVHYGYQWWVTTQQDHPAYFAAGFGGQFIYVVPDFDLVVVIVSNVFRPGINHKDVIGLYVVPAVRN